MTQLRSQKKRIDCNATTEQPWSPFFLLPVVLVAASRPRPCPRPRLRPRRPCRPAAAFLAAHHRHRHRHRHHHHHHTIINCCCSSSSLPPPIPDSSTNKQARCHHLSSSFNPYSPPFNIAVSVAVPVSFLTSSTSTSSYNDPSPLSSNVTSLLRPTHGFPRSPGPSRPPPCETPPHRVLFVLLQHFYLDCTRLLPLVLRPTRANRRLSPPRRLKSCNCRLAALHHLNPQLL